MLHLFIFIFEFLSTLKTRFQVLTHKLGFPDFLSIYILDRFCNRYVPTFYVFRNARILIEAEWSRYLFPKNQLFLNYLSLIIPYFYLFQSYNQDPSESKEVSKIYFHSEWKTDQIKTHLSTYPPFGTKPWTKCPEQGILEKFSHNEVFFKNRYIFCT